MYVPSPYNTVQVSIFGQQPKITVFLSICLILFNDFLFMCLLFSEGLFPAVNLGINAFLSIQIVNTMPGVRSQTAPSLTSAEGARQVLRLPGQVSFHYLCDSTPAVQALLYPRLLSFSNLNLCVDSSAASAVYKCVSLLPRLQEHGLSILSSQGETLTSVNIML